MNRKRLKQTIVTMVKKIWKTGSVLRKFFVCLNERLVQREDREDETIRQKFVDGRSLGLRK